MKYKFTLTDNVVVNLPINVPNFQNDWFNITDNTMYITKGYSWDGCTPKLKIGDLGYIGTPDGSLDLDTGLPLTYYCSLVHDVLYQFKSEHEITRLQADVIFLLMLEEVGFSKSRFYFTFVRLFGGFFGEWKVK